MTSSLTPGGRILVIDDEPVVTEILERVLGHAGHHVDHACDGTSGRRFLESEADWDVLLLDVMLPDADGLQLLQWVRQQRPDTAVVLITAHGRVEDAVAALKAGAFHYLTKPFHAEEVCTLVAQAVESSRLRAENRSLRRALATQRERFERLVGRSRAMQQVYELVEQVAPTRSTVLVQGESGTGKELVAQAIHRRSPRASQPFVVVNSSNIPTDLLEDNLFGHVRGAFTGADADKIGLVEAADRGTLLFDEISTIAPAVQSKLLRVIQEREFIPLGAVASRSVDVRIVAATNEPLKEMVDEGRFREDLFYRLNVISLTLPPLRERPGDLPLLVEHFLDRCNKENGKRVERVAEDAMRLLLEYDWPGNVRQLENLIERGVVLADGSEITVDLLPGELRPGGSGGPPVRWLEGVALPEAVSRYERQLIEAALRRSDGVQKRAARLLGLKPTTLNEKIKRLGIRN